MSTSIYPRRKYPYGSNDRTPENAHIARYMGVDIIAFLGRIAGNVMLYNQGKWRNDIETIRKAAMSGDPDKRRLVWHVYGSGTRLSTEYETFIKNTGAYRFVTNEENNRPDMYGYIIEISGIEGNAVKGNVFEVGDFADYAWHVAKTAFPISSVTLTYSDEWGENAGKTVDVPNYEFSRDYKFYVAESGNVQSIDYLPLSDRRGMAGLLHEERLARMELPAGNMNTHLSMLTSQLYELRGHVKEILRMPRPQRAMAAKRKPSITDRLAVADRVAKQYNGQNVRTNNNKGKEEII